MGLWLGAEPPLSPSFHPHSLRRWSPTSLIAGSDLITSSGSAGCFTPDGVYCTLCTGISHLVRENHEGGTVAANAGLVRPRLSRSAQRPAQRVSALRASPSGS